MDGRIKRATTLIIGDVELNCNCENLTIDDLNITHIGLAQTIQDKFDLILYEGSKGTKLLKSTFTKTGKIE